MASSNLQSAILAFLLNSNAEEIGVLYRNELTARGVLIVSGPSFRCPQLLQLAWDSVWACNAIASGQISRKRLETLLVSQKVYCQLGVKWETAEAQITSLELEDLSSIEIVRLLEALPIPVPTQVTSESPLDQTTNTVFDSCIAMRISGLGGEMTHCVTTESYLGLLSSTSGSYVVMNMSQRKIVVAATPKSKLCSIDLSETKPALLALSFKTKLEVWSLAPPTSTEPHALLNTWRSREYSIWDCRFLAPASNAALVSLQYNNCCRGKVVYWSFAKSQDGQEMEIFLETVEGATQEIAINPSDQRTVALINAGGHVIVARVDLAFECLHLIQTSRLPDWVPAGNADRIRVPTRMQWARPDTLCVLDVETGLHVVNISQLHPRSHVVIPLVTINPRFQSSCKRVSLACHGTYERSDYLIVVLGDAVVAISLRTGQERRIILPTGLTGFPILGGHSLIFEGTPEGNVHFFITSRQ